MTPIMQTQDYIDGVLAKNRRIVAKTITLVESSLASHQKMAKAIVDALLPHAGKAVRIGITGVPGVGKSTYIESFGLQLVAQPPRKPNRRTREFAGSSVRQRGGLSGAQWRPSIRLSSRCVRPDAVQPLLFPLRGEERKGGGGCPRSHRPPPHQLSPARGEGRMSASPVRQVSDTPARECAI